MLLALDIGNTNIEIGLMSHKAGDYSIIDTARLFTRHVMTADELRIFLLEILRINNLSPESISGAIFSSVVPQLDRIVRQALAKISTAPLLEVNASINTGINNCYKNPKEVGSDRLVNASYVYGAYKKDAVIIDLGTATTLCVVTKDGDYRGGVIIPGIEVSLKALIDRASKLTGVSLVRCDRLLADTTEGAVQSGAYFSHKYTLEKMIARLADEAGLQDYITVATGGYSTLFKDDGLFTGIEADLTLKGLKRIADLNREK